MKSKKAWALVKKKDPKIDINFIFTDKEVLLFSDEELIEVEIRPIIN